MSAVMERSCACKAQPKQGSTCFCGNKDVNELQPICEPCRNGQHRLINMPNFKL